jgi:hypothetical protein
MLAARAEAMPVLAGNTLYVGTQKGFVYALNVKDGSILWSYRGEAPEDYKIQYSHFNITAPLVADDRRLLVLGDDGTLTCFSPEAIDGNAPVITVPQPARGLVINGTPPLTMSAYLWDEGSGINPASVAVFLDNEPMAMNPEPLHKRTVLSRPGVTYDPVKRRVEYTTPAGKTGERVEPLGTGRHTVRVQAADWKGNQATMEWTFVVDNSLPVRRRTPLPGQIQPGGYPGGYNSGGGAPGAYPGGAVPGNSGGYTAPGSAPNTGNRGRVPRGRGPAGRRG